MTFANPIAPTDYEAIMGVQPASINPHLASPLYNSGNRFSVMSRNSTTRFADIRDGSSSTVMVVECGARPLVYRGRTPQESLANDQGIGWADSEGPFSLDGGKEDGSAEGCGPGSGCIAAMNVKNDNEPYGFHRGGVFCLFADSHVQFLHETIALPALAGICTMNAKEVVSGN
jgi:hypothetical protein